MQDVWWVDTHDLGYNYIETDVIRSADDKVVIYHGARTKRQQANTGLPLRSSLQSMTYDEISQNVSLGGERLPLMEEALSSFPNIKFNIEPKTKEVVRPLGRLIDKLDVIDRICIASFRYVYTQGVVEQVRELRGPSTQVCTAAGPAGLIAAKLGLTSYLDNSEFACLQAPYKQTTAALVEQAHDLGIKTHVWTPNDEPAMVDALNNGVDGIMSDEIVLLKEVIENYQQA